MAWLVPVVLGLHAFVIEPRWLEVTETRVATRLDRPLVVAHVSDLHADGIGFLERRVLSALRETRPDVIVLTGDVVTDSPDRDGVREVLRAMHAPLGVWAVLGNWEHWRPSGDERAFFRSAGARLLVDESARLRDDVWLVGMDDAMAGGPQPERAFRDVPPGVVTIALFHSPMAFDSTANRFDLAFAGHTHGGQVRLPFVGAWWRPYGSGDYDQGWYRRGRARMYVSRGLGTSILPVRWMCRPELAIHRLD